MSPSDSETPSEKRNSKAPETEEVFDSVFDVFVSFVDEAETIVLKQPIKGLDSLRKAFHKLRPFNKEMVLKLMWVEIARNLLESLPDEGQEAFLVRCSNGLYPKLPKESREDINRLLKIYGMDAVEIGRVSTTRSNNGDGEALRTEEVSDPVSDIFMDFVHKAETILNQQARLIATAPNIVHNEEHEEYNNFREAYNKLQFHWKEKILTNMWRKLAWNLLERLPEGKEAFLVRCFGMLYQKLPREFREMIQRDVERFRIISETEEALDSLSDALMDFVDMAETIVSKQQTRLTASAPNILCGDEHEEFSSVRKVYQQLWSGGKEEILKELWVQIAWNLLERLPEEVKEAFSVRCFNRLYQKLPRFRNMIDWLVEDFRMDTETTLRDSETRGKSSSEEVVDSVFDTFIEFADKAEAIVSKLQTPDVFHDEEHVVREAYNKLWSGGKEEFLKMLWGEIAFSVLETLPTEGCLISECFRSRCFDLLYPKLPQESRKKINQKIDVEALEMSSRPPMTKSPELTPVETGWYY